MAASLLHAATASLQSPTQPARAGAGAAAFHPLASAPSLRLARSSFSSSRRLEVSLPAVSPGHRFAGRGGAPRDRRVVAALAGEQTVSQPSLSEILASVAVSGGEILVFSGVFFFFGFSPTDSSQPLLFFSIYPATIISAKKCRFWRFISLS